MAEKKIDEQKLAEELSEIIFSTNMPYRVGRTDKDLQYLRIAKGNPEFFIADDEYIFSLKLLKDFWKNEILVQLEESKEKKLSVDSIIKLGIIAFKNTFNFGHPEITGIPIPNFSYGIHLNLEAGYISENEAILQQFLYVYVVPSLADVAFSKDRRYLLIIKREETSLIKQVKKFLWDSNDHKLQVNTLVHKLNRSSKIFEISKPVTSQKLQDFLETKNASKSIKFDPIEETVELIDNTAKYIEQLIDTAKPYADFIESTPEYRKGIYAILYKKDNFPLEEAREYVKIRPIIYLKKSNNIIDEINQIFSDKYKKNDFRGRIAAILHEKLNFLSDSKINYPVFFEWINDNLLVSTVKCDNLDEAEELEQDLIRAVSPVINIENNPGNLFYNALNTKQVNFKKILEQIEKNEKPTAK